jgi:DNA invertase Pin-like site-specific DNA recombinase
MTKDRRVIRCAIYTRKSTEEGLDQAFSSLHAQREACEAYVKSQAGEGWKVLSRAYDDGGFSGGNMDRPGLVQLMADVDAGLIDIVVVYKVDRLTRSLADFAKIVERLDGAGASFVSVTQAFNTTTSMGRLTLNVLLSFAQFEREVTGERIRDKIAASKAKGMWMGGTLPLGYDLPTDPVTRALVLNADEAEIVRYIFRTYLELGSVHRLQARLNAEGVRSKVSRTKAGKLRGGKTFSRGALFHLLRNRTYLGEIPHGEITYPGAHPPILDLDLFGQVQAMLANHRRARKERPLRSATLPLRGRIFDLDGAPMSPAFTHRRDKVYRYYVSAPLQQGRKLKPTPGAIRRVAAGEIEGLVEAELRRRLNPPEDKPLAEMLACVDRIDLEAQTIRIRLSRARSPRAALDGAEPDYADPSRVIVTLPVRARLRGGRAWLDAPQSSGGVVRIRREPTLIRGLQQAHRLAAGMGWRTDGGLENPHGMTAPASAYERKLCRLAFLAPDIQTAILTGRQPRGLTLDQLMKATIPAAWPEQRRVFGFADRL